MHTLYFAMNDKRGNCVSKERPTAFRTYQTTSALFVSEVTYWRLHFCALTNCISAWNPHYIKDKELFEKVQRRFTKMINNIEGNTYEERLRCSKLWTLEERRNRQDFVEVLKMCNGLSRLKLNELFTLDDNIRGTRGHSWKLAKFRCTL